MTYETITFANYGFNMQMFDSVELREAINDIYEAGRTDDNLWLIFRANEETYMAVTTPGGLTERQIVKNCVLQE